MTEKDISNWIMYHQIHQMARNGFSKARIARFLVIDPRTVGKYLAMSEHDYEQFLIKQGSRNKILTPYEDFVTAKLIEYPDTSAAQMHDWLKEHHRQFPQVSVRTVYNFVMFIRAEKNIPVAEVQRDYFPVDQLGWGEQAQVDFGQYNMRSGGGGRKKICFVAFVLSRSRMKYIWFSDTAFDASKLCHSHDRAFGFYEGRPATMVYDLDRIMVVDENMGQVLLTNTFKQYVASAGFKLHFCRKADPESKGKVENVVGYVKKNFLYNRLYVDLALLNAQGLDWLRRTANLLPHGVTKQSPQSAWLIEKQHLASHNPIAMEKQPRHYHVRKNNTIAYKSNFYTLPQGTWQGRETRVILKPNRQSLEIYDHTGQMLLCTHQLADGKGKTVINTHHRRETTKTLQDLIDQCVARFSHRQRAEKYLAAIRQHFPRYIRDHLQYMLTALEDCEIAPADQSLEFCLKNELYSGQEFKQVLDVHRSEVAHPPQKPTVKLLSTDCAEKADQSPQTSNLDDYENLINPK